MFHQWEEYYGIVILKDMKFEEEQYTERGRRANTECFRNSTENNFVKHTRVQTQSLPIYMQLFLTSAWVIGTFLEFGNYCIYAVLSNSYLKRLSTIEVYIWFHMVLATKDHYTWLHVHMLHICKCFDSKTFVSTVRTLTENDKLYLNKSHSWIQSHTRGSVSPECFSLEDT